MHIIFWQLKSKFILCPSSFCIFSVKAKSKMKSTTLIDFHWVWAHLMISSANTRKCYPMNLSFERMEFTLHILLSEFNSFSHWTSLKWAGFVWFLDFFLLPWFCLFSFKDLYLFIFWIYNTYEYILYMYVPVALNMYVCVCIHIYEVFKLKIFKNFPMKHIFNLCFS